MSSTGHAPLKGGPAGNIQADVGRVELCLPLSSLVAWLSASDEPRLLFWSIPWASAILPESRSFTGEPLGACPQALLRYGLSKASQ